MPMTVTIQNLTGAGPASADVSLITMNREDTANGTTPIPLPTSNPATNFSYVKSLILNISATGGLTMTNVRVGRTAAEAQTGCKLWHYTGHALGSYVQAVAAPGATADNNQTAPTINGNSGSLMSLTSAPPAVYAAGPFTTTGQKGNLVEIVLGVDATALATGSAVSVATARWSWVEA